MRDSLRAALPAIVPGFRDPWWIIGSAAMALSGIAETVPNDVDVLCSERDAQWLKAAWADHADRAYPPRDDVRFRSCFARFVHLPMPVEVMGGLQVNAGAGWKTLAIAATEHVPVADFEVPVPALREQMRVLRLFGRDKDLAKAALISTFLQKESVDAG